jgi:hypothetical protein
MKVITEWLEGHDSITGKSCRFKKFTIKGLPLITLKQPDGNMYAYKMTEGEYRKWHSKYYDLDAINMAAFWPRCDGCNAEISGEYYKGSYYLLMVEPGQPYEVVCEECFKLFGI